MDSINGLVRGRRLLGVMSWARCRWVCMVGVYVGVGGCVWWCRWIDMMCVCGCKSMCMLGEGGCIWRL